MLSVALLAYLFGIACPAARGEEAPVLTIAEITTLAERLKGDDETSRTARSELVQIVQDQYLSDAPKTQSVPLEAWRRVLWALRRDLSGATRAVWIPKFRAAFAPAEGVVPHRNVMALSRVLHVLGDRDRDETARALFERIHGTGEAGWETCHEICLFWADGRRKADARVWAKRAYAAVLETPELQRSASIEAVRAVGVLYELTQLSAKGVGHMEFAQAVLSLAERGAFDAGKYDHCLETASQCGKMLQTAEAKAAVQGGIAGEGGHLRVGLLEILGWAHRYSGTLKDWRQFLEGRSADRDVPADAKAYWLLARGYAERILKNHMDPFVGRPWMTRALATAQSDEARLYVVRRIAAGHGFLGQMERGLGFLASVEEQFAANREAFDGVRQHFLFVCRTTLSRKAERVAQRELRKVRNHRRALNIRLATARRRGDTVDIEHCERLLREFDERAGGSE
ncbi:MAG: hypothetical protein ABIF82_07115 [Planctomycetota bacterium]